MLNKEMLLELFEYRDGKLYWKTQQARRVCVGQEAGRLNKHGYRQISINGKRYQAHRIVFMIHKGWLPKVVDHIDGNRSNNSIENLREATASTNQHNRKIGSNNTSGVKNVCWNKRLNKWLVRVKHMKKNVYRGVFDNLELAELVAVEARNKFHGSFARHV